MEDIEQFYNDYSQDRISLQDFQCRLRSVLGSFEFLSKDDEEFIKRTDNDIELIIYTIPEERQQSKVAKVYPEVLDYIKRKKA